MVMFISLALLSYHAKKITFLDIAIAFAVGLAVNVALRTFFP